MRSRNRGARSRPEGFTERLADAGERVGAALALRALAAILFAGLIAIRKSHSAVRVAALAGAALLGLTFASTGAQALTINSMSASPSTFTNSGTVITFTVVFNTGSSAWNSVSFADTGGNSPINTGSCSPSPNNATNQSVSCSADFRPGGVRRDRRCDRERL